MIRELGVLDQDLGEHHGVFGMPARDDQQGVAYPMTFVLDERGRVERKIAEANYRVRDGGERFFAQLTGGTPTPGDNDGGIRASVTKAEGPVVLSRARLDSPTYFAYQRLGLHLDLAIAAGWHAYGPTVPDGYQPLRVTAESTPPGARVGPIEWPPTRPFRVAGIAEEFAVYDGDLRLVVPVEFIIERGSGTAHLDVRVEFQACSETECLPPAAAGAAIDVPEAPTL